MNLFSELKRRNVIRVAAAYGVFSWLLLQVGDILFQTLDLPPLWSKGLLAVLLIGFPVALFFSWVYELTPEGLKKEGDVTRNRSITHATGRRLDHITIGMVVLALALLGVDRFLPRERTGPLADTTAAPTGAPAALDNSIAVLPFTDLSPHGDQGYFADGIAEEILNVLVKVDALKVASRTSSFAFKGREAGIPEIATALKVRTILEGSVRKAGSRVRITAQLIDTQNDRHLWSETYDRELTDIFAIQDDIANAIVGALKTTLGAAATPVHVAVATENLDAYDLFLKGRQRFLQRADLGQSIADLEQAVALDPAFIRAWEILAAVYATAPSWGVGDETWYDKSAAAADRALALDPGLGFPYAIKATIALNTMAQQRPDWEQIMAWHDRSIARDAKNPTVWLWRGLARRILADYTRARSDLERCLALDPAYENCRGHLMLLDLATGNTEAALAWLDHQLTEVGHRYTVYYSTLVPLLVARGELRAARLMADAPGFGFDGNSQAIESWIQVLLHPDSKSARARFADRLVASPDRFAAAELLIDAGLYQRLKADFPTGQAMWLPLARRFRQSSDFKRIIRGMNMQPYWRAHGFPSQCRPLGDDDFECD